MPKQRGVTLVELLVALTVLSFMLGVGAPSFVSLVSDNRIDAATTRIAASMNYARNEAVTRAAVITLSRKSGTQFTWSEGWEIYTDTDPAGNTNRAAGDTLLRDANGFGEGLDILTNEAGNNWISFRNNGMLNEAGNPVVIAICDDRGEANGRDITINLAGRVDIVAPSNDCTP